MSNRPTMQDVADLAGVSLSTVDRILSGRSKVKPATLRHVLEVAGRIGFHGVPVIRERLSETVPEARLGFLLNGNERALYADFAQRLTERTRASSKIRGTAEIRHLQSVAPAEAAGELLRLGQSCSAIAAVAVDAPEVHAAVASLALRGIPVFSMLSDITCPAVAGHAGADPRKMGRGAGWMMHRLCWRPGRVALFLGSRGYSAHRGYEAGFRSYLEEHCSPLLLLPPAETGESDAAAEALAAEILQSEPEIAAILVAGGGLHGVLRAIAADGRSGLVVIGTELGATVDAALSEGRVDAVLSHPTREVVEAVVAMMESAVVFGSPPERQQQGVPVEIRISETV